MRLRPRTTGQLILAVLAIVWFASVINSIRYRDLTWLQYLLIDVTWLQVLLLVVGGHGAAVLLVGILSRPPRLGRTPEEWPFVSIVVPAKNEEAVIEPTVRSLCALEYAASGRPCFEVIVVDDQSADGTQSVLERLMAELPLRVLQTRVGSFGKAAALNLGIAHARGDLIAVFDADARVAPDFLQRVVPYLAGERVGGVQSRRRPYNPTQNLLTRVQDDEYTLYQHLLQRARQSLGGIVSFAGDGLLVKRAALDDVGGWNEDALTEDIDLTVRLHLAGWEIRYCEEATVWEEAIPRLRDLLRQRIRWFEGAIRCLGDYLPAILFGRLRFFKRLDLIFLLSGTLLGTLGLLTSYLFAMINTVGILVIFLHLPAWVMTWASGAITASFLVGVVVEKRGRPGEICLVLARSVGFSLQLLLVVPLAIHRYVRNTITGQRSWEKTAHGASRAARVWSTPQPQKSEDEA